MKKKTPAKKRAATRSKKAASPIPLKDATKAAVARYKDTPLWRALPDNLQTEKHFANMITSLVKFSVLHPEPAVGRVELHPTLSRGSWINDDLATLVYPHDRVLKEVCITKADLDFFYRIFENLDLSLRDILYYEYRLKEQQGGRDVDPPTSAASPVERAVPSAYHPPALSEMPSVIGASPKTLAKRRRKQWIGILQVPLVPPKGTSYEWKRYSIQGVSDEAYLKRLMKEGKWAYVPAKRHPDMPHSRDGERIEFKGLVLMQRPRQLQQESLEEDYKIARDQVADMVQRKMQKAPQFPDD